MTFSRKMLGRMLIRTEIFKCDNCLDAVSAPRKRFPLMKRSVKTVWCNRLQHWKSDMHSIQFIKVWCYDFGRCI